MQPYEAGWLSIIPPIVAIALALTTKEVLSSLLIGILTGTLIYTIGTDGNVLMGTLESAFTTMGNKVDFNILIFCSLLGALVYVVAMSGGTKAYGKWAVSKIRGRRSSLLATSGLGILIFIDDYFNCLTVGTVMRPVCDNYRVSRAKLAYIIDSTAAPVCIIAPVSSWAAAVGSSLKDNSVFESDMAAFIATIPWNFYALLSILMIFFIALTNFGLRPHDEVRRARSLGRCRRAGASRDTPNLRRPIPAGSSSTCSCRFSRSSSLPCSPSCIRAATGATIRSSTPSRPRSATARLRLRSSGPRSARSSSPSSCTFRAVLCRSRTSWRGSSKG